MQRNYYTDFWCNLINRTVVLMDTILLYLADIHYWSNTKHTYMKHAPIQYTNLQHPLRRGGFTHTSNNLLYRSYCRENALANFSIELEQVGELCTISFGRP